MRLVRVLVIEPFEGIDDVLEHGEVDLFVGVVPVEVDADVALADPVGRDLVVGLEDGEEVLDIACRRISHQNHPRKA